MAQAETKLITSRRNFLVRALGFTAAGATVAVPIITLNNLRDQCEFHGKALEAACRDYYAGLNVRFHGNRLTPDEVRDGFLPATWMVTASLPKEEWRAPGHMAHIEEMLNRFSKSSGGR